MSAALIHKACHSQLNQGTEFVVELPIHQIKTTKPLIKVKETN
ncbi:hypothetical protein B6N60_02931 [Richelia sinica FACHB-800]|uniref:Uncharacterized protein n=1 Tax=Richelia sinica FACHB-800 TaxID=1357546 RepID=A0A975TA18_9NOST|nr:hypothetical protein [Richelia sinica]QXE24227.1 hypothetical protein B6N60_02931 [Richelia sinica FACHB-800]